MSIRTLLADLVRHRDLLPLLAQQHFRGRFRAARLGIAWSAIQPLIRGAVLAVVFTQFVRIPTRAGVPYPAFVLAGSATWSYLVESITEGTTSITGSAALAGRVYFPRMLLPAMPAVAALPSYAAALTVVVVVSLAVGVDPSWTLLALPFAAAIGVVLVVALSEVLALLHVHFRDVAPLVGASMGILFFATPVFFPPEIAERAGLRWMLDVNPFTGAVGAVRWALFGGREALGISLVSTGVWIVALTAIAAVAYRRHERTCVDRL